ncbi:hypothetical protein Tco_0272948 [Tanacetum coccineum]
MSIPTTVIFSDNYFGAYWADSLEEIAPSFDLRDYWSRISSDGDILSMVPFYTSIRDALRRLCHRLIAFSISRRGQAPKKGARMSGGHFVARLAKHFRLITEERLRGLTVVSLGPERQQVAATRAA